MTDRNSRRPYERKRVKKSAKKAVRPQVVATRRRAPEAATGPRGARRDSFPIVGIGSSAGGLEALDLFFKHVPERCGMAFVVIQHLDPKHKDLMVELLQRATALPVVQAMDRLEVEPDHVYVIPPNRDLSIQGGVLRLFPRSPGLNLPIDFFFCSLAADLKEQSIGVVLSGMGSDGTLGLRAIKEKAGACFAQAPASAKFDSMPRSAIEAGLADVVAPVEELPGRIINYHQHALYLERPDVPVEEKALGALEKVFALLRTATGNDFSLYKPSTILRRVERRMGLHQIGDLASYVHHLRESPGEAALLSKELLIGVTSFFRDPAAWEQLKSKLGPMLASARPKDDVLRAWVPGCSTGEEAYSLAMVFEEALEQLEPVKKLSLQIFATDLDREAIEKARAGVFPAHIAADVSPERLRRFFVQEQRGYRVGSRIREMVVFAPQNLVADPPFTKLHLLACRNLLIYMSQELQKRLVPVFHFCLEPAGILFLGSAETIGGFSHLFSALDRKARIYRRVEAAKGATPVDFPDVAKLTGISTAPRVTPAVPLPDRPVQTAEDIAQKLSLPTVLTNDRGDILYVGGQTEKFLHPATGKARANIFKLAREGLLQELASAFSAALKGERPASARGLRVATGAGTNLVDLTVKMLTEPKELQGTMMIVFADAASAPTARRTSRWISDRARISSMEREVERARAELEFSREEMQTSQEELKSTNEELQSTNEELQSTNEELTTSKEEMQSMNEELQTINQELQSKVDELSQASNDIKNLLDSTDIATLFLDGDLLVRRFTPRAAKIIKLIPSDSGRPFTDLTTSLDYPELADDAREVLRTLVFKEKLVAASDERWFSVRIMPYRTLKNVIDGLVITFTDASAARALEGALRQEGDLLRKLADSLPHMIWSSRADGAFDYLNRQWLDYTGVPEQEQLGQGWLQQVSPEDRERVRSEWHAALESGATLDSEFRIRDASGAYRWFKARAAPTRDAQGRVQKWYGTATDIEDIRS
jgi:two-component system CheB/CheR fusion protein